MAQSIDIRNVTYADVPYISVPVHGSSEEAIFIDTSDATLANGSQMPSGVTSYANGVKVTGTAAVNDSTDLTASGATVTAPAGFYAAAATKSVASGTAKPPTTISGSQATLTTGTNTITLQKTLNVTPQVTAGYVSSGTQGSVLVSLNANVTTKAAATITPGTTDQTIASGTYLTGAQIIEGDSNLKSSNIVSGVSIFSIAGSAVVPIISQDQTGALHIS